MRRSIALVTVTATMLLGSVALTAPAQGKVFGPNGRIAYGRFDPAVEDFRLFTANADGTHKTSLLADPAECPQWSPDGSKILLSGGPPSDLFRPATITPDGTGFTRLDAAPNPRLSLGCGVWSPDGSRVALEGFNDDHPTVDGIYSARSSDGGDLVRVTDNPFDMNDRPGDYSPDGSRIVFLRTNPLPQTLEEAGAIFVVNTDGTGLHRLTPWGFSFEGGSWSPDGQWILFQHPFGHLFVVHPDGTGLRQIPLDTGPGRSFAFEPGWSPDGERIVFSMYWKENGYQEDIFTVGADGSDLTQVTNSRAIEEFGDWGPHPLAA